MDSDSDSSRSSSCYERGSADEANEDQSEDLETDFECSQGSNDSVWFLDHCKEVNVSLEDAVGEDQQYEKELLGEDVDSSMSGSSSSSSSVCPSTSSDTSQSSDWSTQPRCKKVPKTSLKRKFISDSSDSDDASPKQTRKFGAKAISSSSDAESTVVDNHNSMSNSDSDDVCFIRKRKLGCVIPLSSPSSASE